jgi:hypothetical protein
MSENRDSDTGQYTSPEPLTGQAGVEADQGYKPMVDWRPEEPSEPESSIKEEALKLAASRVPEDPVVPLKYQRINDGSDMPLDETITLDRAVKDVSEYHAAQVEEARLTADADVARWVDGVRAETLQANPEIAKELGLSKEEVAAAEAVKQPSEINDAARAQMAEPSEPDAYADIPGLAPETSEWLKKAPAQGRQFLEQNAAETEQAAKAYQTAVAQAQTFGQASLMAVVPELSNVPTEQWAQAIQIVAQQNPAKGQQIVQVLQNVAALSERQQLIDHYQQSQRQQEFETVRSQYNKAADQALGPMTRAEMADMAEELADYVGELGITRAQLAAEAKTNLALHHPAFQKMAADAIRYQRLMKAPKARPTTRSLPVSRPGTSSGVRADTSNIKSLERQLASATTQQSQLKIAARLLAAKRAG